MSAQDRNVVKSRAQPHSLAKQELPTTILQVNSAETFTQQLGKQTGYGSHQHAKDVVSYCLSRCSNISVSEAEARVAVELGGGGLGAEGRGPAGGRGAAGGLTVAGLASPSLKS